MASLDSLRKKLAASLLKEHTSSNRRRWAAYIIKHKVPLHELLEILQYPIKEATRFSWMIGDLCELSPSIVFKEIPQFFKLRTKVKILHYERSLARMMWLCGIPSSIEGEAVESLFQWLTDPKGQVSIKVYSIYALENLCLKYPDLQNELRVAILSQKNLFTVSFRRCCEKVLERTKER